VSDPKPFLELLSKIIDSNRLLSGLVMGGFFLREDWGSRQSSRSISEKMSLACYRGIGKGGIGFCWGWLCLFGDS
jgi:hypothetical protein